MFDREKQWLTSVLHGIDRGKAWLTTLRTPPSDSSFSSSSSRSWDTRREALARLRPRLGPPAERPGRYHPLRVVPYLHANRAHSDSKSVNLKQTGYTASSSRSTWIQWMPARSARKRGRPRPRRGQLKVTLAYTADETQNVSDTILVHMYNAPTAFVQVNGTDNLCVSAVAESTPEGTSVAVRVTIPKVVEPCTMTVPATQPASPWPGITAAR